MALISSVPFTSGRCSVYVLPCAYEDLLKLGFSRNPLARLQALHPRWFEAFDLDRAFLVETETVRDARALELELRRAARAQRAGDKTEIKRGQSTKRDDGVASDRHYA